MIKRRNDWSVPASFRRGPGFDAGEKSLEKTKDLTYLLLHISQAHGIYYFHNFLQDPNFHIKLSISQLLSQLSL